MRTIMLWTNTIRTGTILSLGVFGAGAAQAALNERCLEDAMIVACFVAFESDLLPEHDGIITGIADHIASEHDLHGDHQTYLFTGHAAQFSDTDYVTYLTLSFYRAENVAAAVRSKLEAEHDLGPRDITLLTAGAAIAEPRPGVGNNTQTDRALNRRVEFERIPAPETPEEACTPLDEADLQAFAVSMLGREPAQFDVGREFSAFWREAQDSEICRIAGMAGGQVTEVACVVLNGYISGVGQEFSANPEYLIATAMGAAYAITDGPSRVDRTHDSLQGTEARFRDGFRVGYADMRLQMAALARNPTTSAGFTRLTELLECEKNGTRQVNTIYDQIMAVLISEAHTQRERSFFKVSGNCRLSWPELSVPSCGPY